MIMRSLLRWFIGVVAIVITVQITKLLHGAIFHLSWPSLWGEIVFVPVLAITNAILGTILRILSMPISCATLGLFAFVIGAIVFWVAGNITGASMGLLSPLVGSILYTLISIPLSMGIKEKS